jgi:hypothetical protein
MDTGTAMTRTIADRSLHAKAVKADADPDRPLLVALVSNIGNRHVHRLDPVVTAVNGHRIHGDVVQWRWRGGIVLTLGDDTALVSGRTGTRSRWRLVAFVTVGVDGEPTMQDDGTGRTARELAAEWLWCDVGEVDALLVGVV